MAVSNYISNVLPQQYQRVGYNNTSSVKDAARTKFAVSKTEEVDETLTLEEFKRAIDEEIRALPIHPSQSNTMISVTISDKAYEKMMKDPECKKAVMAAIQRDFMGSYPAGAAPSYSTVRIDDNCEYSGDAMGSAYGDAYSMSTTGKNSFEIHKDKKKIQKELDEEWFAKKQKQKLLDKKWQEERENQQYLLEKALMKYENHIL